MNANLKREWLTEAANRWSLELQKRDRDVVIVRNGLRVTLSFDPVDTTTTRQTVLATMLGVRLAADRIGSDYNFDDERPHRPLSDKRHEAPSLYGERAPMLVQSATVDVFEKLTSRRPVLTPFLGRATLYVRAWKRDWHVFIEDDFQRVNFGRESLTSFARYTLFNDYGTQHMRGTTEHGHSGDLTVFESADGWMTGRATLMPDLANDAAQAYGCFSVPTYNCIVVGHPKVDITATEHAVSVKTREIWKSSECPFMPYVWKLTAPPTLCDVQWQTVNNTKVEVNRF